MSDQDGPPPTPPPTPPPASSGSSRSPTPPPTPASTRARLALAFAVLFLLSINGALILKSCSNAPANLAQKAGEAIEKAGQALRDVAAAFHQGRVTTEFISYASTVSPTHRLQFATLRQTDIFTRTDAATTGFGYIPLPEIVVEARAPVEYTYFLDLNAEWKMVLENNVIHVLAPKIQFNQPAVDVSALKYELKKGSVFRDHEQVMEDLKQSITQLSRMKARENIGLVRETGRRQTAEFVEKWLAKSFTDGGNYPVKVYFPGEPLPDRVPFSKGDGDRPKEPR